MAFDAKSACVQDEAFDFGAAAGASLTAILRVRLALPNAAFDDVVPGFSESTGVALRSVRTSLPRRSARILFVDPPDEALFDALAVLGEKRHQLDRLGSVWSRFARAGDHRGVSRREGPAAEPLRRVGRAGPSLRGASRGVRLEPVLLRREARVRATGRRGRPHNAPVARARRGADVLSRSNMGGCGYRTALIGRRSMVEVRQRPSMCQFVVRCGHVHRQLFATGLI